ncbi:MAG: 3-methyl-2-oxobutanoate hydroxymethyltransferase [Elusimicrobiota bacterium]
MKKIRVSTLKKMKEEGLKISALTCYSYSMARIIAGLDIDIILVGDSVGMVELGYENTIPVTVDDIIYHLKAVSRARSESLLVADMPFLSFNVSREQTLINAGRMVKEGGAEAVKLEGGRVAAGDVRYLVERGIAVMGHIGLTPQSVHKFGGYRVQGREEKDARRLVDDARALEEAGVFCLVLEGIPEEVAGDISSAVSVPTIGIGAGKRCDGQIMVLNDILGMDLSFKPKFVRRYARLEDVIKEAVSNYSRDVKSVEFPSEDESY